MISRYEGGGKSNRCQVTHRELRRVYDSSALTCHVKLASVWGRSVLMPFQ